MKQMKNGGFFFQGVKYWKDSGIIHYNLLSQSTMQKDDLEEETSKQAAEGDLGEETPKNLWQ